jgi:hypothetical protein
MSEEMPPIEVENLIQIFIDHGREGLIKELCVFEHNPRLNKIMEEMVDLLISVFTGEVPPGLFVQKMEPINNKFYDTICDIALDEFNEGNLESDQMKECIDELNEIKAKYD